MKEILKRELLASIYNSQFMATLLVVFLAVLLSLVFGALQHVEMLERYNSAQRDIAETMKIQDNYSRSHFYFNRQVPALYYIAKGYNKFMPLTVQMPDRRYRHMPQFITTDVESNILFAIYGNLDFPTTFNLLMTLAAMLFGHAAICGEKENGTLKMLLSSSYSRFQVAVAKYLGGLFPILIAYALAVVSASIVVEAIMNNAVTGQFYDFFVVMALGAGLIITYYSISFSISSIVYNSKLSALLCILFWLLSVFLMPTIISGMSNMASEKDNSLSLVRELSQVMKNIRIEQVHSVAKKIDSLVDEEGLSYGRAVGRAWTEADAEFSDKFSNRGRAILDRYARQTDRKMSFAKSASFICPPMSFLNAVNEICGAGYGYYTAFKGDVERYTDEIFAFLRKREKEDSVRRRLFIKQVTDESGNMRSEVVNENFDVELDLSDLPVFPIVSIDKTTVTEYVLIAVLSFVLWIVVSITVVMVRLKNYDVR